MSGLEAGADASPRLLHRWPDEPGERLTFALAVYASSDPHQPHPRIVVARDGAPPALVTYCCGTGEVLAELPGNHQHHLATYKRPSDGWPRIVSGGAAGWLRIFDGDSYELLHEHKGEQINCLLIYYEPREEKPCIVTGGKAGGLRVLDGESGELLQVVEGFGQNVTALSGYAWGGRQRLVVGGHEGKLSVYDPEAGQLLCDTQGHTSYIYTLACFESSSEPRQPYVVSGSDDRTAKLWDGEGGGLVHSLEGHQDGIFLLAVYKEHVGGCDRIATGSHDRSIKVWDAKTGSLVHTLRGQSNGCLAVYESSEGSWRLVSGSRDTVSVWDPEAGRLLHTLESHRQDIAAMLVLRSEEEGRYRLVSGCEVGEVRTWDLGELPPPPTPALPAANKTG
jgi:WD40 repeat protein